MINIGSSLINAFFRMVYTIKNVGKLESERTFNLTELEQTKQKLVSLRFKKTNCAEAKSDLCDSNVVNFPNKLEEGLSNNLADANNQATQSLAEETYTVEQLNSLTLHKHKLISDPLISSHVEYHSVLTVIK